MRNVVVIVSVVTILCVGLSLGFAESHESDGGDQYKVIARTVAPEDTPEGKYAICAVIPAKAHFTTDSSQVFGPSSKQECEAWVLENCVESTPVEQ